MKQERLKINTAYTSGEINMNKMFIVLVLTILIATATLSCDNGGVARQRAKRAEKATGEILIAAAGSWADSNQSSNLWEGIEFGLEEINKAGVLNGRKFRIIKKDDSATIDSGRLVAEELSDNPDIVAVIGHYYSYITLPASAIYDLKGMLLISPNSQDPELTGRSSSMLLDIQPDSDLTMKMLMEYAAKKGFKRVAMCYVNDSYGSAIAKVFEKTAERLGISVADVMPFGLQDENAFKPIIAKWKDYSLDAIFLTGYPENAHDFRQLARQSGLNKPLLVDITVLSEASAIKYERDMNGTILARSFDPASTEPGAQDFIKQFTAKYGHPPAERSAAGYEAIKLLAEGMRRAGSTVPAKVAAALRTVKSWQGLSGKYSIKADGDIEGKPVFLEEVKDGRLIRIK